MTIANSYTVTVSYTENEITKTATYDITVSERPKFTVTFNDDSSTLTEESAGSGITLPTRSAIGDYTFAGWSTTDITVETSTTPTILTGTYKPSANITLYPVYTRLEASEDPVETKTQTLVYDTWTYSGSTADKSTYRMFGNGSYIESAPFDLSTLSKVIVYGGTFGGGTYNSLTIGDGTNVWKNVTVSGSSQTGTNEYTGGTALSDTKPLRIISKSGDGSSNGIRISKVEIFTLQPALVSYYTSHPSTKSTPTWSFSPASLPTLYVGEDDATLTVITDYNGTLTASSSDDAIATVTKTGAKTFTIHAVGKGDATLTFTGDETDDYKAISKQISVSVLKKYAVTINASTGGMLVIKNGEEAINSGDKFLPGTVLTAEVTPDADYNFRNWQAVDGSTHTYTASFTYTMVESDVTFKANFDAKVYHKVNWSVNGVVTSNDVEENTDIDFSDIPADFDGYQFIGWTEEAIDGTTNEAPTLISEATMGTADKTYYAVYGEVKNTSVSATFDAADISETPATSAARTWMHTDTGITLYISDGRRYTSGTPNTFTVNSVTGNYFMVDTHGGKLTDMTVTLSDASYKISSIESGAKLSISSNVQTVTFTTDMSSVKCYATNSTQIRATVIVINAIIPTVNRYATSLVQNVAITSAKYATYCSNEGLDFSASDVKAYTAKVDGNKVVLTQVANDIVPANTGVILYCETAGNYDIPVIKTSATVSDNEMVGVTESTPVAWTTDDKYYNYILQNGVFNNANGGNLKANRAYLHTTYDVTATGARALVMVFDGETTGIKDNKRETITNSREFYNLNGQRVAQPTKGLYIVNGRKVVIR